MGTASTMATLVEALGLSLPGNSDCPAYGAARRRLARETGAAAVDAARQERRIRDVCTKASFENAIRVLSAIGGSTNAIIHLIAVARRLGIELTLEDFDLQSEGVPNLVNLEPAGEFAMEDYYRSGGTAVVVRELTRAGKLHDTALTVTGRTIAETYAAAPGPDMNVIYTVDKPFKSNNSFAVLKGNIAPKGAVIKVSAASPELLLHEGPAFVFESVAHMRECLSDPEFDLADDTILVLRNCGPRGYPGMPEVANMPLPRKVLARGIRDMVRISDARMSGSAFGTVVLHVSPESRSGGPLSAVKSGDRIRMDVAHRSIDLLVGQEEIEARLGARQTVKEPIGPGYEGLYLTQVNEASDGADFDFLLLERSSAIPLDNH
jgi:dihydroxy-acid dehydratase